MCRQENKSALQLLVALNHFLRSVALNHVAAVRTSACVSVQACFFSSFLPLLCASSLRVTISRCPLFRIRLTVGAGSTVRTRALSVSVASLVHHAGPGNEGPPSVPPLSSRTLAGVSYVVAETADSVLPHSDPPPVLIQRRVWSYGGPHRPLSGLPQLCEC
jgi:hypothetical protein